MLQQGRRDNGTGSIYLRKDGRWCGSIQIGFKENGKPNIKSVYGKSQAEVKRKLKELVKTYIQPTSVEKTTFQEYCTTWFTTVQVNLLKPSSYDRKEISLEKQVYPLIGFIPIGQIRFDDIQDMVNTLREEGKSYSTIKKAYECVNGCFKHAIVKGDLNKNPCYGVALPKTLKRKQNDIKILTDEEIKKMLTQAASTFKDGKPRYRLGYAVQFLLYTGLRIGEALALNWSDVNFENKTVRINKNVKQVKDRSNSNKKTKILLQNDVKTKSGERIIPLNNKAIEALEHIKEVTGQLDFILATASNNYMSTRTFDNMLKAMQKQADIEKSFGAHTLRHTFASLLFRKGVDVKTVSEILGHKDVSVTYDTYIHLIQEQKVTAINLIDM